MYEIGKAEDNPNAKGLAFLKHPKIKDCVTDIKTYSNRVIKMEVKLRGKDLVTGQVLMHQHLVHRMKKRHKK